MEWDTAAGQRWSNIDLDSGFATVDSLFEEWRDSNGSIDARPPPGFEGVQDAKSNDHVFLYDGEPWKCWKGAFNGAVERAGIKDFHFHDLRNCYGSWLALNGVPDKGRMELMGHKDPKMTMRYTHLSMERKRIAVIKLPSFNILDSSHSKIHNRRPTPKW
jgi:integrase